MIPVIIKKEDVLASLFAGNEVLNIYYSKSNKPLVRKLTESAVEDVISLTKSLDSDTPNIFIELRKNEPAEEEKPPVEGEDEEKDTEEVKPNE